MMLVSRRRTIPGTVEGTEIPCEHFGVNADRVAARPRVWECGCVLLSCGYVPMYIAPCGLIASLSLTAR